MTSTQVECFLEAARSSSFSKAAQNLFMTPPTFGRQIAALEQEVGYPLFVRGAKNNKLTAAGQVLYQGCEKLLSEMEDLLSDARKVYLGNAGSLKIGLLEGQLLDENTVQLLKSFQKKYPEIEVQLSRHGFRSMLDALRNHELDIGITLTLDVQPHPELAYQELFFLQNELIIPRNHPLAEAEHPTLADFSEDVFLTVAPEESEVISGLMLGTCRNAGFEPKVKYAPDLKSQILCLEQGQGITAFNKNHQACNHPFLKSLHLPDFPDVSFCAAWMTEIMNPALPFLIQSIKNDKGD